jgi:hypothetical protein
LGGQFEADGERIEEIQKHIPLQYAELEEGLILMHFLLTMPIFVSLIKRTLLIKLLYQT